MKIERGTFKLGIDSERGTYWVEWLTLNPDNTIRDTKKLSPYQIKETMKKIIEAEKMGLKPEKAEFVK